jgi:hypothetical protein
VVDQSKNRQGADRYIISPIKFEYNLGGEVPICQSNDPQNRAQLSRATYEVDQPLVRYLIKKLVNLHSILYMMNTACSPFKKLVAHILRQGFDSI